MLPGLLLVVILGLSLALLRLFLVAGRDSPALVESLSLPGSQWKLVQSEREFGPFTFAQLARFAADGVLTADSRLRGADGSELAAGDLPGLFAPRPADWPTQPVHFQTFAGKADPVRLGRGSVRIEGGDLVLHGRRRRLFALRREDERIPVAAVENVVVDGRLVEFDRRGEPRRRPRLLRLAAPEAARALAACLPGRRSAATSQVQQDIDAYAAFNARRGRAYATLAVIAANLAVFVAAGLAGAGWASGDALRLFALGGNFGAVTASGEWYRLFSAMFLHSGFLHVGLNMAALWEAGSISERLFGRRRYLAIYLAAGLAGGIASINWHPDKVGIGASGAVFGIYGALAMALVANRHLLPPTIAVRLRNGALLFIAYSLVNGFLHPQIDNAAHIGGLVAGALAAAAYQIRPPAGRLAAAALVVLVAVGVVRAHQIAEPLRDEMEFKRFLADYSQREGRLEAGARQALAAADRSRREAARRLDGEVIAGWKAEEARLAAIVRVSPASRALRDPLARLIGLRRESLELLRDALTSGDPALLLWSQRKQAEANRVAQELIALLDDKRNAGVPSGKKPAG